MVVNQVIGQPAFSPYRLKFLGDCLRAAIPSTEGEIDSRLTRKTLKLRWRWIRDAIQQIFAVEVWCLHQCGDLQLLHSSEIFVQVRVQGLRSSSCRILLRWDPEVLRFEYLGSYEDVMRALSFKLHDESPTVMRLRKRASWGDRGGCGCGYGCGSRRTTRRNKNKVKNSESRARPNWANELIKNQSKSPKVQKPDRKPVHRLVRSESVVSWTPGTAVQGIS